MKTTSFNLHVKCANNSSSFFSPSQSHSASVPQLLYKSTRLFQWLRFKMTPVYRVIQTGLVAYKHVLSNRRYTAGVVFLLILAPLSSIFYRVFNPAVIDLQWYYANWYYFFYTISPYLMLLFASVGIFLLFPQKCKTSYLATVWPAGFAISKIIFFAFFVNDTKQFHSAAPWFLLIISGFAAIGFILAVDYLLYRKYHLLNGTFARIAGIIKMPGVDAQTKIRLLEHEEVELENFNQRY